MLILRRKVIINLVLSFIFLLLIIGLVFAGAFDFIEDRIYYPSVTEKFIRETASDAKITGAVLSTMYYYFSSALENPAVKRCFLSIKNPADILERSAIFGILKELIQDLLLVRLTDSEGQILFSSDSDDVVYADGNFIVYRHYNETDWGFTGPLFSEIKISDGEKVKLSAMPAKDFEKNMLIFSLPLSDMSGLVRGTALFAVSANTIINDIAARTKIPAENVYLTESPFGIVSGFLGFSGSNVLKEVCDVWACGYRNLVPLVFGGKALTLVSVRADFGFYYGRVINSGFHTLTMFKRTVILILIFLFFSLIIFIFNIKQGRLFGLKPVGPKSEGSKKSNETVGKNKSGLLRTAEKLRPVGLKGNAVSEGYVVNVIYEKNGIPFISNNAFTPDSGKEKKPDNEFRELVESVIGKQ